MAIKNTNKTAFCIFTLALLFAAGSAYAVVDVAKSDKDVAGFRYLWSKEKLVDIDGCEKQLLRLYGDVSEVKQFCLYGKDGALLDTEPVLKRNLKVKTYYFGFWVPLPYAGKGQFVLEITHQNGNVEKVDFNADAAPKSDLLPLRLDKTGQKLKEHILTRENNPTAKDLADFVPDMDQYLYQHRIIYAKPAQKWQEGQILGNGTVGALVCGDQGGYQRIFLDRCDLWGAMPDGNPMGRFYAGQLDLAYDIPELEYRQELSLSKARLDTQHGDLKTIVMVCADRDVILLEMTWYGTEPLDMNILLQRLATPMPMHDPWYRYPCGGNSVMRLNGSFNPENQVKKEYVEAIIKSDYSTLDNTVDANLAAIKNTLPNISYAMAAAVDSPDCAWRDISEKNHSKLQTTIKLQPGRTVSLTIAVSSNYDGKDCLKKAQDLSVRTLANPQEAKKLHCDWWKSYWSASFVEIPDKFMENMWYFGAYHQAIYSRGLAVPSFFGLWHPLDWRTWMDNLTADVQTTMTYWACYPVNHPELMLASHNTYAGLLKEYTEHAPAGAQVPHCGYPDYAGDHSCYCWPSHAGSTPQMGFNFWNDYLFTGDKEFLKNITYPMLARFADYAVISMEKGNDGLYHCHKGDSPEQHNTARDNIYNRATFERALLSAIEAAGILGVDPDRVQGWQDVLDNMYPYPQDEISICETNYNKHPYRCHAAVMYPVYPAMTLQPGDELWGKARGAYDIMTNLIGHNPYGRHDRLGGHEGGLEPISFNTSYLLPPAARIKGWDEVQRIYYALVPAMQLMRNGRLSTHDIRHTEELIHMGLAEGTSGPMVGLADTMVQNYPDHVRVFAACSPEGVTRFSGLRAYGAFLLAGEFADGKTRTVKIYSIKGNKLRIMNPWQGKKVTVSPEAKVTMATLRDGSEALEIETRQGRSYELTCHETAGERLSEPIVENRSGPRKIMLKDADDFDPPVVIFPTDRLAAQFTRGDRVYLGMPLHEDSRYLEVGMSKIKEYLACEDWAKRQTAVRWLWRLDSAEAEAMLEDIRQNDPSEVVRLAAEGDRISKMLKAKRLADKK